MQKSSNHYVAHLQEAYDESMAGTIETAFTSYSKYEQLKMNGPTSKFLIPNFLHQQMSDRVSLEPSPSINPDQKVLVLHNNLLREGQFDESQLKPDYLAEIVKLGQDDR